MFRHFLSALTAFSIVIVATTASAVKTTGLQTFYTITGRRRTSNRFYSAKSLVNGSLLLALLEELTLEWIAANKGK